QISNLVIYTILVISNIQKKGGTMKKLLLLLLSSVFIFGFTSIDEKIDDNVKGNSVRIAKEFFLEMEVSDYRVKSTELINDFNNNKYYLLEFSPNGYGIFDYM